VPGGTSVTDASIVSAAVIFFSISSFNSARFTTGSECSAMTLSGGTTFGPG
jgi:hypothetical protein